MYVLKRNGNKERVVLDKITNRISKIKSSHDLQNVDPVKVAIRVVKGIYDGVSTVDLDILAAETAATMATLHYDYAKLAACISVSNLHKETERSFFKVVSALHEYVNPKNGKSCPMLNDKLFAVVRDNEKEIEDMIDYSRDYDFDYFGFKTLEKSYLLRLNGKVIERPQHMMMRVALGIHYDDLDSAKETYDLMSKKYFTHATPTLFNSGTVNPQMASCFLLDMSEDSISGIYKTLSDCAQISKHAGGIGLSVSKIRSKGSYISGTNGTSNGLVPMLRVYNNTARYVDQGGGRRKGSFAIYLEPWHADVYEFLDMRKNQGYEESRARDLFYALWIPDLFMKRVTENGDWSLMCPDECRGLYDTYGEEFEKLYVEYEKDPSKVKKVVKAQDLWNKILVSQIETGTPYMLYKDSINRKSNQKNLGTIKSSNLCAEICEYTDEKEIAVCNLASICLSKFVKDNGTFDHEQLRKVTWRIVKNLNKVIDESFYPLAEAEDSNKRHRPIGIGIQGLADVFVTMRLPFASAAAKKLNEEIFETIYFSALECSNFLAIEKGPYSTFEGSPLSKGMFQFDMWDNGRASDRWDWNTLKCMIKRNGVRNSLLVALMPTASTSQIMGNNDGFEPFTSNVYVRRVLAGEYIVTNKHLLKDLTDLGLWTKELREELIRNNGSVQNLNIPKHLKELYKTSWEISPKDVIDMAVDRGRFVDQSQSMNIFLDPPNMNILSKIHVYAWKKGLKTGMYYLRTKSVVDAVKFTIPSKAVECIDEVCVMCSS